MELAAGLARYAHALGRWQAAWRFAAPELRRAVALAQVVAAWDVFRRDAGPGDVGPAHETPLAAAGLLASDDPRRDGFLLWLADHGAPAIVDAATLLARAAGAARRFDPDAQALVDAAAEALAARPSTTRPIARLLLAGFQADDPVLETLGVIAAAIDQLRADPAFLEGSGEEACLLLPGGALRHFVPAAPGAAWALNLALLARPWPVGSPHCPALVSRQLFRALEPDEIAAALVESATAALETSYVLAERIEPELKRGREALSHLSRNARAGEAWLLVAALGAISRGQLARALGLSRAGADIQARVLSEVGLVTLAAGGRVDWRSQRRDERAPAPLRADQLGEAAVQLDAAIADIDRLLARTSR